MSTDAELLQRYARDRDERAFAELVQRHLGVVYGAALRRTGGRTHLVSEDRVRLRLPDVPKDSTEYQKTAAGWKYVLAEKVVDDYIRQSRQQAR